MRRTLRIAALCALAALTAVSSFAQSSPRRGTVIDIDEGRGRLEIEYDEDRSTITVETDAVSTVYQGFGGVISGKPEIFTGSSGFSNIRLGDRIEIRGSERGEGVWRADRVTLIGREVAADTTGVGTTRDPNRVSTPIDDRTTGTPVTDAGGAIEGAVRSINPRDGRIVIQTAQRRMISVRAYDDTPVIYNGRTYDISSLEVGDRIRIEPEQQPGQSNEITARSITVTQAVQDAGPPAAGNVTSITGRITRVEPGLDRVYVDDTREEIRVDMIRAQDASGAAIHARDLRVGDMVEIIGNRNRVGDAFEATTVRLTTPGPDAPQEAPSTFDRPALVTTGGAITESLEDAVTLGLRETDTNQVVRIWVAPDFVVRTKAGTYVAASTLREKDTVIVQAYRDARGNLIAQTIRLRNR